MPLCIPTKTNAKLLAPRKVKRMLLTNRPVQLTFKRMKQQINLIKKKNSLLEQLENLRAVIDL
jgi:hypothetical protein